MKLSSRLLGRRQIQAPTENDQDFLEGLIVPLLVSLMGIMVLSLFI